MHEPLLLAVVGCGRWGPNHIRNFCALPGARVSVCVDPDKARRAHMETQFPDVEAADDIARVLNDPSIAAVVVASPTATHHAVVKACLKAGKHVLCEKPLCETGAQARELAALARKTRRVLMTGHVFLFNGGLAKVKELADSGALGKIHYLSAVRTNLGPIRSDVNAAYDLASHDVAVFNWLLGETPRWASATGGRFLQRRVEDVVFITLQYPSGACANVHASWLNPKKVRQLIAVGSRKMVSWDDMELSTPVAVYDKGAHFGKSYPEYGEFLRLSMWDGDVRLPKVTLEEPLKAQARAFLEAVRRGKAERSGPDFSAGVVRALEAAQKSMRAGGRPVRV